MRIGDLAKLTGVSASTLRFYETEGLLPAAARRANGYRDYDRQAVEIVKFIDRARRLDFGLSEVAAHFRLPRGERRKARLQEQLEAKLSELDTHINEMRARRAMISDLVEEVRKSQAATIDPVGAHVQLG
jgi:MerR family copper efflux transcriptional regulator